MKCLLICLAIMAPAFAQAREGTGVGLLLGAPSGFTARHWFSPDRSFHVDAGWSLADENKFHVQGAYLWDRPGVIAIGDETLDFFFGAGASVRTKSGKKNDDVVVGPRLPGGVSYFLQDPDLELFAQLGLTVGFIPSSDIFLDAAVGLRFYF